MDTSFVIAALQNTDLYKSLSTTAKNSITFRALITEPSSRVDTNLPVGKSEKKITDNYSKVLSMKNQSPLAN
ncbi:MAG: hypothetical protein LBT50_11955 [Prevotellaceae bacterium]|nr:hypothetical protein [Prevotellaceae bacterium]